MYDTLGITPGLRGITNHPAAPYNSSVAERAVTLVRGSVLVLVLVLELRRSSHRTLMHFTGKTETKTKTKTENSSRGGGGGVGFGLGLVLK